MLRRLATLSVLLISLSGVIPAAMACALIMQGADCCPQERPCDTDGAPAVVVSIDAPCCMAQPAPTRSTATVSVQSDRRFADSPVPDHFVAPAFEFPSSPPPLDERTVSAAASPIQIDQQQIYLRTGRLRL